MGDLPVPPADRLPTPINGSPKLEVFKIFLLYSQLLMAIPSQKSNANGNNKIRKDFRKKPESIRA